MVVAAEESNLDCSDFKRLFLGLLKKKPLSSFALLSLTTPRIWLAVSCFPPRQLRFHPSRPGHNTQEWRRRGMLCGAGAGGASGASSSPSTTDRAGSPGLPLTRAKRGQQKAGTSFFLATHDDETNFCTH